MKIDKELAEMCLQFLEDKLDETKDTPPFNFNFDGEEELEEVEFMYEVAISLVKSVINEM